MQYILPGIYVKSDRELTQLFRHDAQERLFTSSIRMLLEMCSCHYSNTLDTDELIDDRLLDLNAKRNRLLYAFH